MNISESVSRMAKMAGVFNFATVEKNQENSGRGNYKNEYIK